MTSPFTLPNFYMPYPARLNPNLEAARVHSKRWAHDIGILGRRDDAGNPPIWDETAFDSHGLRAAVRRTPTPTAGAELDLITDWYVWVFFFDDHFLEMFKRTRTVRAARSTSTGCPPSCRWTSQTASREPTNPVEAGLADLWARTVPAMSVAWRPASRTAPRICSTSRCGSSPTSTRAGSPTPRVHRDAPQGRRRALVGRTWSSTRRRRTPRAVAATRPLRVLTDAFADGVHLRNDLFSYQREVEDEGELSNGVLVFETLPRLHDTQEAADAVNDLLTSRLQQFENTALTEVPALCEENGLDPAERRDVAAYVKGLQDWQSGGHEWHMRSSRYMNGGLGHRRLRRRPVILRPIGRSVRRRPALFAGASAADRHPQLHPRSRSGRWGQSQLPDFYMPFPAAGSARTSTRHGASGKQWARADGDASAALSRRPRHLGRPRSSTPPMSPLLRRDDQPRRRPLAGARPRRRSG